MSKRAAFSQTDMNRAAKAAASVGYQAVFDLAAGVVRLLPIDHNAPLPSDNDAESEWDKALGLQS